MLSNYKDALKDARQSIRLDDKFAKGYLREGKCHMALGDVLAAVRCYRKVLEFEGHDAVIEDIKSANAVKEYENISETNFRKGDFKSALFYIDRCIEKCPACNRLKIKRAAILVKLEMYEDADEVANDILQRDNLNADAFYVKGLCLYYTDNVDKAYQFFQRVLQLAPYHASATTMFKKAKALIKKEEGNDEFRAGRFQVAYNLYSEALAIDPCNNSINSILYCNRATCSSKLGKTQQCIDDCTKAIELDDSYVKAYLTRAKCYMKTGMYEEAIYDYKRVNKLDKSLENERLLQEAMIMLEKTKKRDYYNILGVPKTASINEIKKHYKTKAKVHHPDRHRHDTPEKQKAEEIIFKQISQAYSVLSDPKKKEDYDRGWMKI